MGQLGVVAGNFGLSFSLIFSSIFVQISGSIRPITLIWVSLEDLFLLQKLRLDDANFGQKWWRQMWKKGQGSSRPAGRHRSQCVRTFARKFSNIDFFSENFTIERWWVSDVRNEKKWGVTDFVLARTCPEEHLNLSKSGFVSGEGHSGCKSQNIAIRALKGNVLCQIWLKWTYLSEFCQLVRFLKGLVRI